MWTENTTAHLQLHTTTALCCSTFLKDVCVFAARNGKRKELKMNESQCTGRRRSLWHQEAESLPDRLANRRAARVTGTKHVQTGSPLHAHRRAAHLEEYDDGADEHAEALQEISHHVDKGGSHTGISLLSPASCQETEENHTLD